MVGDSGGEGLGGACPFDVLVLLLDVKTALQLDLVAMGDLSVVSLEDRMCLGLAGGRQVVEYDVQTVVLLRLS